MVGICSLQCRKRHLRKCRISRVLHDGNAAGLSQRPKPCGAVAEGAGQNDPNRAKTAAYRCGAQHRIDRRPDIVLARACAQHHSTAAEEQMAIGRRNIDATVLEYLAVAGESCL
jgi:hypothetical protein